MDDTELNKIKTGLLSDVGRQNEFTRSFVWRDDNPLTPKQANWELKRNGGRWLSVDKDKTSLPENFTVRGDIYIVASSILRIPETFIVGGSIYARGSSLCDLSDNFTVNGDLDITDTYIFKLPSNLHVKGNLYMNYCLSQRIPLDLQVDGEIHYVDLEFYIRDRKS